MKFNHIIKYLDLCRDLDILITVRGIKEGIYAKDKNIIEYNNKLKQLKTINIEPKFSYYYESESQLFSGNNLNYLDMCIDIINRFESFKKNTDYKKLYLTNEQFEFKISIYEEYDRKLIRYFAIEYIDILIYIFDLENKDYEYILNDYEFIEPIKKLVNKINNKCKEKNKEFLLDKMKEEITQLKFRAFLERTDYENNMLIKCINNLMEEN